MKKKIALIMAAIFVCGSFAACGSESASSTEENTAEGTETVEETEDEEATEAEVSAKTEEEPEEEEDAAISVEEQVLIDNDCCTIQLTGVDIDPYGSYVLDLYLENKSDDITYMFSVDDAYVNGVQNDPFFATEIAPGKKSNSSVSFSDMEEYGIDEFTDIEIVFHVYDSDDWFADPVVDYETVHVYPYGEEKAVSYSREAETSDVVLVDNDNVTLIMTGHGEDDWGEFAVDLFFVNKTDANVVLSVDDCSVNGFMIDPFFATSLRAGKCKYTAISWWDSDLEENGITDVEEIEFSIRVYDDDDWLGDDFANEMITLDF